MELVLTKTINVSCYVSDEGYEAHCLVITENSKNQLQTRGENFVQNMLMVYIGMPYAPL